MTPQEIEKFVENNKVKLVQFFDDAKQSRVSHSVGNRLVALEFMVCAVGASLDGENRERFLAIMNSFSVAHDSNQDDTFKAIADLNVLSADFKNLIK
ncbi:hypothetical protein [Yersinia mollaretii]|uniref:hypothetical protein n=1 Tax=Yersinia mollaretii TaxID=33060 RepID=UPI0011A86AA8|nr:hypothetical protein [Yersinia mollaretii]